MVTNDSLRSYFDKARRFDQDRLIQVERSARIAWSIAIGASVLAGASIFAVAGLTPLKTVEPFVVRVDNSTGIVDVVSALTATAGTYDEAVTKYFAAKYVRAREGYVWSEAEENFRTVALLSTQPEQTRFAGLYRGSNPESPQNTYGRSATARINIVSISLINDKVVSVRYMRTVSRGEDVKTTHWVTTLTFAYVNPDVVDRPPHQSAGLRGQRLSRRSGGHQLRPNFIIALLLTAGCAQTALALDVPSGAMQDNRVRFVNYQPYNITKIVGTLRSSVQIEFAADEEIAHVALGNSVAWEVAPAGNILFLKPRENQPVTNISVVTTRRDGSTRSYQMELTVRDGPVGAGQNTYFYVKYRYPADEAERRRLEASARAQATQSARADQVLSLHEAYGPRNWRYSAQGAQALEPQAVYDNGKVTTFAFVATRKCRQSISKIPTAAKAWCRNRSTAIWCWCTPSAASSSCGAAATCSASSTKPMTGLASIPIPIRRRRLSSASSRHRRTNRVNHG